MFDFEKLGVFYLGKSYDLASRRRLHDLLLYDSKDLVTHGVCVGMTGSGKTGLCIALLEEAAIDGIPALIIDPKGDLGNLLLNFPDLRAEDFAPWINPDDARRKGLDPAAFAQSQADLWRKGLADWDQDPARIRRLRDSADMAIYTPGSSAGVQLSILKTFDPPSPAILADRDLYRDRVQTTVSALLALLGIEADPMQSREHILLSSLVAHAWEAGSPLDLGELVKLVQQPPMTRIGVMEVESFYPQTERFALAMRLNSLLASPGFAAWTQGQPLDIQSLLYTPAGKPRLAIVSIAHLSDSERMFFVSTLLSQFLSWTRQQSGTTSLRAILYMDEIAGYCPPVANPPSKAPMLTLMKQGRAFGIGVLLATQNPVDLDYKGLSNAGTWFIGRLQTDRDKQRVLDGLEGAASANNARFDRAEMDRLISGLGQRVFLMNNVHDDQPVIFETRWCLSYLRGPLTRDQIKTLIPRDPIPAPPQSPSSSATQPASSTRAAAPTTPRPAIQSPAAVSTPPVLPPGLSQFFLPVRIPQPPQHTLAYAPALLGSGIVHFSDSKLGVEHDDPAVYFVPINPGPIAVDWQTAEELTLTEDELDPAPARISPAAFIDLPPDASRPRSWSTWQKDFADLLLRQRRLELLRCDAIDEVSQPGESERDFRARLTQATREQRDAAIAKLRARYAPKVQTLTDRLRRAQQQIEVQEAQARDAKLGTALSFGSAILGAILGRKAVSAANVSRAATAARGVSRSARESSDVGRAEETAQAIRDQLAQLETTLEEEIHTLTASLDTAGETFETITIRAKKTQVKVRLVTLAWLPHWRSADGLDLPAYR
jgi:hypothetical protein